MCLENLKDGSPLSPQANLRYKTTDLEFKYLQLDTNQLKKGINIERSTKPIKLVHLQAQTITSLGFHRLARKFCKKIRNKRPNKQRGSRRDEIEKGHKRMKRETELAKDEELYGNLIKNCEEGV